MGAVDAAAAFTAGAYLGWRAGWRFVSGFGPAFYQEPIWLWLEWAAVAIVVYLVAVANFRF